MRAYFFLIASALGALSFNPTNALAASEYRTSVEVFRIPREEIPKLEAQALGGSGDAAYRLSKFYEFLVLDIKEADYWLNIAAENDNPTAQYGLGSRLSLSSDKREHLRACYWLIKSKQKASSEVSALADSVLARLTITCRQITSAP